jgi:hypothetical protein
VESIFNILDMFGEKSRLKTLNNFSAHFISNR